jgi:hypothetical protein
VHAAVLVLVVVVLDLVLVDEVEVAGTTGRKTTSFMCSGTTHMRWFSLEPVEVEWLCELWVLVVNIIDEHSLPVVVKLPWRPMELMSTLALPMFLT